MSAGSSAALSGSGVLGTAAAIASPSLPAEGAASVRERPSSAVPPHPALTASTMSAAASRQAAIVAFAGRVSLGGVVKEYGMRFNGLEPEGLAGAGARDTLSSLHDYRECVRMPSLDYELLDFGDGRKLERFGSKIVDRPCPTAEGISPARPDRWNNVAGRYCRGSRGLMEWVPPNRDGWADPVWRLRQSEPFRLELALQPLPSGQVGVFPEQTVNWAWIHEQVRSAGRPLRVLNLFAYTGASTIAAAAAGAEVTHVDAAESTVSRASMNAGLSGLAQAPIRWIVDDAVKFCRREVRRGRRYDAVILDPPTYGHGKKGEVWRIERDLPGLLALCLDLTEHRPAFVLLTGHTTGFDAGRLARYLTDSGLARHEQPIDCGNMQLRAADGRTLPAGFFARFTTLP